jgi:hypothetical protein
MFTILKKSVGLVCLFLYGSAYSFDHAQNVLPSGAHRVHIITLSPATAASPAQANFTQEAIQQHGETQPEGRLDQEEVVLDCPFAAAQRGEVTTLRCLVREGIDVNQPHSEGRTPLHHAAAAGREEVVRFLVIFFLGQEERIYLDTDQKAIEEMLIQFFLGGKMKYDANFLTAALHWAIREGDKKLVGELIEAGADVNRLNTRGQTALHLGARAGHLDVVGLLVQRGADVKKLDVDN